MLPWLGGSAAVWNTCMMFFQGTLLLGYVYAFLVNEFFTPRRQIIVHCILFTIGLTFLPLQGTPSTPDVAAPISWLLQNLVLTVGLPLFMVTTQAPLLQRWFGYSDHSHAQDPYFLYSGSNIGSFLALLGFPFLLEPLLGLKSQLNLWSASYVLLLLLTFISGGSIWSHLENKQTHAKFRATTKQRTYWVLMSFAPSSLLLSLTNHFTTDIAPLPLLWMIPLALYIATFIICFAKREILSKQFVNSFYEIALATLAVIFLCLLYLSQTLIVLICGFLAFFILTLSCHQRLANSRPELRGLTEFYIWLAVGGFLGGVFNAIVAPLVFNYHAELPLTLILLAVLRPAITSHATDEFDWIKDTSILVVSALLLYFASRTVMDFDLPRVISVFAIVLSFLILVSTYAYSRRWLFAGLYAIFFLIMLVIVPIQFGKALYQERNFYGVYRILQSGHYRVFLHGRTLHGIEKRVGDKTDNAFSYYGSLRTVIAAQRRHKPALNIAVVGLGAGTISCLLKPEDKGWFFELDPLVLKIAKNKNYFTYLSRCGQNSQYILGDGRLSIKKQADRQFDLIILDAFSSDAVPVHLLTLEATQLYLEKLSAKGIIAFHISNRHLSLLPILQTVANTLHLKLAHKITAKNKSTATYASHWVLMAREWPTLHPLITEDKWLPGDEKVQTYLWTDNFSNILHALSTEPS
jgi:spermidine synthase